MTPAPRKLNSQPEYPQAFSQIERLLIRVMQNATTWHDIENTYKALVNVQMKAAVLIYERDKELDAISPFSTAAAQPKEDTQWHLKGRHEQSR